MDEHVRDIEDALVAHWSHLGRWDRGEHGALRYETPLPQLPYNGVIRTSLAGDPDDAIATVLDLADWTPAGIPGGVECVEVVDDVGMRGRRVPPGRLRRSLPARGVRRLADLETSSLAGRLRPAPPFGRLRCVVPEAPLERTEHGLVPVGEGWFVLDARDAQWRHADGRGGICSFEGEPGFAQVGINLFVLAPGEPMSMYHWEADQEDFLVLAGDALLIVEGEERPLRRWDLVHCPPGVEHTIVGAGDGPCAVLAIGARDRSVDSPDWGGYTVDEAALRHRAGVERATTEPREAYAHLPRREPRRYRDGWLPG